jgi:ABC-type glycerol-3-phosphate transport system permease component
VSHDRREPFTIRRPFTHAHERARSPRLARAAAPVQHDHAGALCGDAGRLADPEFEAFLARDFSPANFSLDNYWRTFAAVPFGRYYFNSIVVAVSVTRCRF